MFVSAVNVGTAVTAPYQGREIKTAFFKHPVEGAVYLGSLGFTGDQQVYHEHGGADRAALIYSAEHFPYWATFLGRPAGPGFLGENITAAGLTEEDVCIGDLYRLGETLVQVSQPRIPCAKVNVAHASSTLLAQVIATGYTGFFVRVLEEGHVVKGDRFQLVDRPERAPSVAFVNRILYHDKSNMDAVHQVLRAEGLAEAVRQALEPRLAAV